MTARLAYDAYDFLTLRSGPQGRVSKGEPQTKCQLPCFETAATRAKGGGYSARLGMRCARVGRRGHGKEVSTSDATGPPGGAAGIARQGGAGDGAQSQPARSLSRALHGARIHHPLPDDRPARL